MEGLVAAAFAQMTIIVVEMQAQIAEYEHALEHVADPHEGGCPQCAVLARSALGGVGRADFQEMAAALAGIGREISEAIDE
jgi:hypothetical protein